MTKTGFDARGIGKGLADFDGGLRHRGMLLYFVVECLILRHRKRVPLPTYRM